MNSSSSRTTALSVLMTLGMTLSLAACSPTLTTQTAATEADRSIAAGVCRVWVPVTYSGRDTEQTQIEARANNAARVAYCSANSE